MMQAGPLQQSLPRRLPLPSAQVSASVATKRLKFADANGYQHTYQGNALLCRRAPQKNHPIHNFSCQGWDARTVPRKPSFKIGGLDAGARTMRASCFFAHEPPTHSVGIYTCLHLHTLMPPGSAKPDADLVLTVFPACSLGSGGSKTSHHIFQPHSTRKCRRKVMEYNPLEIIFMVSNFLTVCSELPSRRFIMFDNHRMP